MGEKAGGKMAGTFVSTTLEQTFVTDGILARVQDWDSGKSKGVSLDIRKVWEKEGEIRFTTKGISVNLDEAEALLEELPELIEALKAAKPSAPPAKKVATRKGIKTTKKVTPGKVKAQKVNPALAAAATAMNLDIETAKALFPHLA